MARLVLALLSVSALAQNYDESRVGTYTLPDPLIFENGARVRTAAEWTSKRRPEILRLFETNVYGRTVAGRPPAMTFEKTALDGKAIRKQVTVYFTGKKDGPKMNVLIYLPKSATPVPVFLCLSFSDTPFQAEKIIARGYGLATINYREIEPDSAEGIQHGIRPLFYKPGQTSPAADEWGAIGAWAWGMSRAMDYLESDRDVDAKRVIAMGHSRLGKTALWAGAQDSRFAMVIAAHSGEGGAALSRRDYGETVKNLNTRFPWWTCATYKKYSDHVDQMPTDQHMLLALIAPRPLYLATAEDDLWADPRGEFLSAVAAGPVYRLLGKTRLPTNEMPALEQPIIQTIGFHIRRGKHEVTAYDWDQFLAFADQHFGRK
jgi:hypothetical protein